MWAGSLGLYLKPPWKQSLASDTDSSLKQYSQYVNRRNHLLKILFFNQGEETDSILHVTTLWSSSLDCQPNNGELPFVLLWQISHRRNTWKGNLSYCVRRLQSIMPSTAAAQTTMTRACGGGSAPSGAMKQRARASLVSYLLLPATLHLLRVPWPPKILPHSREQTYQTSACGGYFTLKPPQREIPRR